MSVTVFPSCISWEVLENLESITSQSLVAQFASTMWHTLGLYLSQPPMVFSTVAKQLCYSWSYFPDSTDWQRGIIPTIVSYTYKISHNKAYAVLESSSKDYSSLIRYKYCNVSRLENHDGVPFCWNIHQ